MKNNESKQEAPSGDSLQRLVRSCCKCGMQADTYCQSCAESRAAEKVGSVAAILYNALRFLGEEELHRLGVAIAERSNATFTPNAETSQPDEGE